MLYSDGKCPLSKYKSGYLSQPSRRRELRILRLFDRRYTRNKVHLMRLPDRRPMEQFPHDVQRYKYDDPDVVHYEVRPAELDECREAVEDDEDRRAEDAPDGEPGLESAEVYALFAVEALRFHAPVELEEGYVHRPPGDESGKGCEVVE